MNNNKKIGLFALTMLVMSSSIGSGIFGISTDLADSASPGAAIFAMGIVGFGIGMLCLSLLNLMNKKPELHGLMAYAEAGFGPFGGFISGWGYWLSSWLGNVASATIMMSALGYFLPVFGQGNNLASILLASVILWGIFFLVNRGVESAAVLNGIITVCKLVPLFVFIVIAILFFKLDVFTSNFWGTLQGNFELKDVWNQIQGSMMVLMWVFVGIEGAAMMSERAESKAVAGRSTLLGLFGLIIIYLLAGILPYGIYPREEIAAMGQPSMGYLLEAMVGRWGASMINIGLIISTFGCWLSWTLLPAETTLLMAESDLLPKKFGELNAQKVPTFSLAFTTFLTQLFLASLIFSDKAYNVAYSLCTAAIFISWLFVTLYQMQLAYQNRGQKGEIGQFLIGLIGTIFFIWVIWASGIEYLLLCLTVYVLGLFFYAKARKTAGYKCVFNRVEWLVIAVIVMGALLSIVMLMNGQIAL